MQKITVYLRCNDAKAVLVDEYNQTLSSANTPAITRGVKCDLVLKLIDSNGEPLAKETIESLVAWDFVLANDWITTTVPQIRVFQGITVQGNAITIPLSDTNTVELINYLGNSETKTLGAELAGYQQGEIYPAFLIQFDLNIRNRRSQAGTGTPTNVPDGSLNASQTYALLRSKPTFEFSVDGVSDWHTEQNKDADLFFRFRYLQGAWSEPIELLRGIQGQQGLQGIQGIQGQQGIQGLQGIQGIQGEKGQPAPLTMYQYSVDAVNWHDQCRTETDVYDRISTDGGITWSAARYFRGLRGFQGQQGKPGVAGAGWNDLPAGSAVYMAYIHNQTVLTFELGQDGQHLVSRNGKPIWEREHNPTFLQNYGQIMNFNTLNSYQQNSESLASGGYSGGATNTPQMDQEITKSENTTYEDQIGVEPQPTETE